MKKIFKYLLWSFFAIFILFNIVTAFHAYKLTHFYDNGSVVIKKKEDKSSWDTFKEILFGINVAKQKNADVPDSTYQTVYIKTKDGIKLNAWHIKVDSAVGTVILFHGHASNKTNIIYEASAFRKMGYNTLLVDFRSHGSSEGNTCTIGYYESEDVKLAYDFVKGEGEKNIVLWGISMGAAAITKSVSDYNIQPQKIILEMPFGSILSAVKGRIKMMNLPAQPLATFLTFWGGTENGFWAFNMKPSEFVKKITCPTLLQWGKNDARVTQAETDGIFKNIPTAKKLVVYENSGHESLQAKETEKWIYEVSNFLK